MHSYPLLVLALAVAACAQVISVRRSQRLVQSVDDLRFLPPRAAHSHQTSPDSAALELLNVVLLASVDGKFHAVDRRTGQKLWSMAGPVDSNLPSYLGPLVSTRHPDFDPDFDDPPETYIIEPQSGDIYVTAGPSEALQRLPFSMSQLVEMSPFSFGDHDRRVFVGRKKTSLLVLELQTGRVKAALDSECPWEDNPFEDFMDDEIDLDELDGSKEAKEYPVEIQIGRSDYLVSIHQRRASSSSPRVPTQNLSFASYGPNNQDQESQMTYHRTPDDVYIEPLPNGEVIAFKIQSPEERAAKATAETDLVWGQRFSSPIVAVFDVVRSPQRRQPFILLQPRPRLDDTVSFFELTSAARRKSIDASSAFVGLVEETGSLYALSPDHYALVIFGGTNARKTIDPPPTGSVSSPSDPVDLEEFCRHAVNDRRCATGLRPLREDSRSRLARLLDGVPSVVPPSLAQPPTNSQETVPVQEIDNRTFSKIWLPFVGAPAPSMPSTLIGDSTNIWSTSGVLALLACTMFALGTLWASKRRVPLASATPVDTFEATQAVAVTVPPADDSVPALDPRSGRTEETSSTPSSSSPSTSLTAAIALVPSDNVKSSSLDSPSTPVLEPEEGGEEEGDDSEAPAQGKKKGTRRKRGRRKKTAAKDAFVETEGEGGDAAEEGAAVTSPATEKAVSPSLVVPPTPVAPAASSLVVSDSVLGFGSHGTVVYQGSLQGRAVAVKRLLNDFTTLALREVSLLQDADDHPNVIRYYYQESHSNFLYIALELCPASLADVIERPNQYPELSAAFNAKRALREIASGLRHLHALKIVHRDIKPQNILVADAKKNHRMLISDFGLCRKLELDQTSFLPTAGGAMGVGTFGWRAPEILRGDVKLDDAPTDESSMSSRGSTSTATSTGTSTANRTRLTKSVDIFALGCLFYYCLTSGSHPFGDRFEREVNIIKNVQDLSGLEVFGEEGAEAADLITKMVAPEAADRPDTTACLMHPYFWDSARRLAFLQDASDRFEIMCRDPRDPMLVLLETGAVNVVGNDWVARLDRLFVDNLGKFRKYDGKSVQDLLRALRNKRHHYQDLPDNVKRHVGAMPDGFLAYFTRRYPHLFLHVHRVVAGSTLRSEALFRAYFSVPD